MKFKVILLKSAQAYLRRMSGDDFARIQNVLKLLEDDPTPIGARAMDGRLRGFFRYRVGNYRIIYEVKSVVKIINILDIGPRGDVCKGY